HAHLGEILAVVHHFDSDVAGTVAPHPASINMPDGGARRECLGMRAELNQYGGCRGDRIELAGRGSASSRE
ncbi:hypothetical protein, partial [Arthrobacter sp. Hiyo1]|uniref:hypothetical protein n=1 Tax=Arthrobacter sp. Hiyo1 TaxID=1588020 RepID=UPI000ABA2A6B